MKPAVIERGNEFGPEAGQLVPRGGPYVALAFDAPQKENASQHLAFA